MADKSKDEILHDHNHDGIDSQRIFEVHGLGRNRGTRGDNRELKISRAKRQSTNEEPKLPKGYRHIRSAIEAVLACAGEHVQADLHSRT